MSSTDKRARPPKVVAPLSRVESRVGALVDGMLASLRASRLKLTPQRIAIVRELAADPTHPTAQELFERLRPAQPSMSFATVYNTLDALASAGLCAALSLAPGASRFDPNMRPHNHAVCDRCGLVRDVACEGDEDRCPEAPLAEAPGFEIRSVERIYRGVCAVCIERIERNDAVKQGKAARGNKARGA